MAANYFTDEQVKGLLSQADAEMAKYADDADIKAYKALMNLAVETAIGEVVAYEYHIPTEIDGWQNVELSRNELDVPKDTIITNLYSVQELDN